MSITYQLSRYLSAAKALDEHPVPGDYPMREKLRDELHAAEDALDAAVSRLIDDRIESATGARP